LNTSEKEVFQCFWLSQEAMTGDWSQYDEMNMTGAPVLWVSQIKDA
jgi:hypothetical protein